MVTIWKNTQILDNLLGELVFTDRKDLSEIAVLGSKPIVLSEFPKLKGIFRVGVGIDNVPIEEARERGIRLQFTSDETNEYIFDETSSFTCHLIFKMIYCCIGSVEPWLIRTRGALKKKRLLVIGMGNIGQRVAKKMRPFMHVDTFDTLYNDIHTLKVLISVADCVTIHIPLNAETLNFLNAEKFSWMKKGAVIINTSRGAIVNEDALYKEICEGRLRAAFDVFWGKPYEGKLKEFYPEGFFMTPHVASKCNEYLALAAKDLLQFIEVIGND